MRIKEGYILRKIAGSDIVIPVGNNIADFYGIISLNETAAFLWNVLKEKKEVQNLVDAMIKEYEVGADTAKQDVDTFVSQLQQAGILVEE